MTKLEQVSEITVKKYKLRLYVELGDRCMLSIPNGKLKEPKLV
jgi:hypothetical protein